MLFVVSTLVDGLVGASFNPVGGRFTLKDIFLHNHNWDVFKYERRGCIRGVVLVEVERMLSCGKLGWRAFSCPKCGELRVVCFGCNSRVCTHCGKWFADKWADSVANSVFDVAHRHVVFTIPEELRRFFFERRDLLKVLMDGAVVTVGGVMGRKLGAGVVPGVIVVLHTYGKDLKFNPHLHCLVTEGGFKKNGCWADVNYFPFEALRRVWQYQLLTRMKGVIADTLANRMLVDYLFKHYPKGFYVRARDVVRGRKGLLKYIGRYIRHPAVAESRIEGYDGKNVTFWYEDDEKRRHRVVMPVMEFISAVTDHIPDRQFKCIRHYGVYSRGVKRKFKRLLGMVSMVQQKLVKFVFSWAPACPKCGTRMEYVWSGVGEPPPELNFGEKLDDWNYM